VNIYDVTAEEIPDDQISVSSKKAHGGPSNNVQRFDDEC